MAQGQRLLMESKYVESIESLNKVIQYKKDEPFAYLLRGIAKYQLSDKFGAEQDFDKAIDLLPNNATAFYYRSIIKTERKKYQQALSDINNAIELNEKDPDYWISRGLIYMELNDTNKAIENFDISIRINPKQYNAFLYRSTAKMYKKDLDGALKDSKEAIALNPFRNQAYLVRGRVYAMQHELDSAVLDFKHVIADDSTDALAYYYLAVAYHENEKFDTAYTLYSKVISKNPLNALVYFNRAILESQRDNFEAAVADYNEVIKINPKNIIAYYNRGMAYYRLERNEEAINDINQTLELMPEYTDAYQLRAMIRRDMGDYYGYMTDVATADSINQQLAQGYRPAIDTTNMERLIQFKADFRSFETASIGEVQYQNYDIVMVPILHLALAGETTFPELRYVLRKSKNLNVIDNKKIDLKAYQSGMYNSDDADDLRALNKIIDKADEKYYPILLKAIMLYNSRKFIEAQDTLSLAQAIEPANHLTYFVRGNLYFVIGELINSMEPENQLSFGNVEKQNFKLIDETNYRKAIDYYTSALNFDDNNSVAYYNRGYVKSILGYTNEAISDYSKAIVRNPKLKEAYYNRGLLHIYQGNYQDGCSDLSRAGELGLQQAYSMLYKFCD